MNNRNIFLVLFLLCFPVMSIAQDRDDYRKDFIKYHKKYIAENNIEPVLSDIIVLKKPEVSRNASTQDRNRVDSVYQRRVSTFRDSLYFAGYLLKSGVISGKGGPDVVVKNDKDAIDLARKLKFDVLMTYIRSNKFLYYRLEPITMKPFDSLAKFPITFRPYDFEIQLPEFDYCKIERIEKTYNGSWRLYFIYPIFPYTYKSMFSSLFEGTAVFHLFRGGKILSKLEIIQPPKGGNDSQPQFFINGEQIPIAGEYADYKATITGADLDYHKRMAVWYFRDHPNERCKYPVKSSNWKIYPTDQRQGPLDDWEVVYDDQYKARVRYKAVGSYWCNVSEKEQLIFPIEFILNDKRPEPLNMANDPENMNAGKE